MSMLKRTARKKYRLVCLLCAAGTSLSAQGWDSTYRPDIYQARVSLFSTMPATKKDMVFIGDSITFWGDWGELLGNKKIKNRGIPGDTSFGLLERLASTIAGKPSGILIMIGINDLARGIPADVLLTNYKRILDTIRLHSPRTKIYFQSILPINDAIGKLHNHYKHAGELPAINTRIDLRKIPEAVADFFIVCEASSTVQVKAIADAIEEHVKHEAGESPYRHEGYQAMQWILIDYVNIVVHIFQPETRKFYKLEEMWNDGEHMQHN